MSAAALPERVLIDTRGRAHRRLAERTRRALTAAGVDPGRILETDDGRLGATTHEPGPTLWIRAGAWFPKDGPRWPPSSATGLGVCAFGAVRIPPGERPEDSPDAAAWTRLLRSVSGDLARGRFDPARDPAGQRLLESPAALYLDAVSARQCAREGVATADGLMGAAFARLRVVHYAGLDVYDDPGLRVLLAITALQRGGAERVALDLIAALPAQGVRCRLATLATPSREAFPAPAGTLELAGRSGASGRDAPLAEAAGRFGADLIHAHLLSLDELRSAGRGGAPVMATVHNARQGWPRGLADVQPRDAVLLAACSGPVAAELRAAAISNPVRTARNGVNPEAVAPSESRAAAGRALRRDWGFGDGDLVLVVVANPRPQKRLDRLPGILAAVRRRLPDGREARLVICGDTASQAPGAQESLSALREGLARRQLEGHVRWTGSTEDVGAVLAAADVLVSTSDYEGLSLAQLEALAAGRPVVATAVGGAADLARGQPSFATAPPDAGPEAFAEAVLGFARRPRATAPLLRDADLWSRRAMASRYAWLYRTAARTAPRGAGVGVWLVANNFSTGGAQSSARRLLAEFQTRGVCVRAAVVEETPGNPTPGLRDLERRGVPIFVSPQIDGVGAREAAESILEAIARDRPESVVFWNLRPECKAFLADALWNARVFDVSPGAMFFESLDSHYARARPGHPCADVREYGALLAGVVVKYGAEAARARAVLGAPVQVIPNGVPLPPPRPPPDANRLRRDACVLGTAARIHPHKRLEDVLAAFRRVHAALPGAVLRVAGRPERGSEAYAARIRDECAGLPVEWLGELPDLASFHQSLDLFVMASDPPGCPNASLEAMAAGLPVVATDVGGASEQVVDGETGRMAPPRDPDAMAAAILEVAADPDRLAAMGAAGRRRIVERFSLERMTAAYERLLLTSRPA